MQTAQCLLGGLNIWAYALSHLFELLVKWSLIPQVFRVLTAQFGTPKVDLLMFPIAHTLLLLVQSFLLMGDSKVHYAYSSFHNLGILKKETRFLEVHIHILSSLIYPTPLSLTGTWVE